MQPIAKFPLAAWWGLIDVARGSWAANLKTVDPAGATFSDNIHSLEIP